MFWQKDGVSIPESEVVASIAQSSARPVCIFLIGANGDLKKQVMENFLKPIAPHGFDGAWLLDKSKSKSTITRSSLSLQRSDIFHVSIYEESAGNADVRRELVRLVRQLDVETTVGLFVDDYVGHEKCLKNRMAFAGGMSYASGQICAELHRNPPSADEYDILFTVTGEEI